VRALFSFVGGTGHYEPLAPIARAAAAAGHTVTFACRPSMVGIVERDGFVAFASGPDVEDLEAIAPLAEPDRVREERVLRDGFARWTARRRAADIGALCAQLAPDVVVCDEVDFGAVMAAEQHGVVHATVLVLASGDFARHDLIVEPLNEVRAELGLAADPDLDMLSRYLVLVPFPASFRDPAFPLPPTAHGIRPAVLEARPDGAPPRWMSELGTRPAVYFTLGTIFNMESGDLFTRVLEGLGELPVDVIATVGRQIDPAEFGVRPPHVHIERFIPQSQVLPHCDAVVSHAGSGTVIGALAFGLPSVLLPMGGDQLHNAARSTALGVATVLDPVRSSAVAIRDAVAGVLADSGARERAGRLRQEIEALPEPVVAVALLERLVAERRPIRSI
jgi:UDP:flavonoid glycosyltransferase YjiC (YdhE family)